MLNIKNTIQFCIIINYKASVGTIGGDYKLEVHKTFCIPMIFIPTRFIFF